MKIICLVLLLTAYVSAESEEEFSVDGLEKIFELKCRRKSGETAFDELGRAFDDAWTCLRRVDHNITSTNNYIKDCDTFANNPAIYECVTPIGEKLRACLDEEESFLPEFLYGAFNHTLIEFCGSTGKAKFDYIQETYLDDNNGFENINMKVVGKRCFPLLAIFKSANNLEGKTFIVRETEICSDMVNFQTCVVDSIKDQTKKDHSTFVHYLMEPYLSWCVDHVSTRLGK